MGVEVSAFQPVPTRADELGCTMPSGFLILPENFEEAKQGDELRFAGEAATALKLLQSAGLPATKLTSLENTEGFVHNHSADWALPIIFIGSELLKQNPDMVTLAIGVMQNHVLELFKGVKMRPKIKAEVVIEDKRTAQYKRLTYEGDVDGLRELTATIKAMSRHR